MYFLSQIPYYDRCDYIRIGHQRNVTKGEILKQEDEFMEKQSDVAKKRYKEYKDEHNFSKKLGRERLDSKVKHLSSDAQDLYKKIYAVVDNNDVTPFQEFQLCHTIINEAKFKAVVEASALLPSKFYPETYNGHFIFYENENPDECDDC